MMGGFIIAGFTAWPLSTDYDAWLIKTDSNGAMEWDRKFGGTDGEGGGVCDTDG